MVDCCCSLTMLCLRPCCNLVISASLLLYLLQWLFVLHCFCTFYNGRMAASNGDVDAAFVPAATLMQGAAALGQPAQPALVDLDGGPPNGEPAVAVGQQGPMRWNNNTSGFVLMRMAQIVSEGSRTDKTYKDKDVNAVAKALRDYSGVAVSPTQVYNHLRKWKQKWAKVAKLKDLSGATFDDDVHAIMLEQDHYLGHCKVLSNV